MLRLFLTFGFAVLTVTPTFAQQVIAPDPDWGVSIGPLKKDYRFNGNWESEERPVYLATFGEDCASVAVETVVVSGWMWATMGPEDSAATPAYFLLEKMQSETALLPPCDEINLVTRRVNEDTGDEIYFQFSGQEPLDADTFAALTEPEAAPAAATVQPQADWGVSVGGMRNSYFDKSRKVITSSIPTWLAAYGDGCADLIVETVLLGPDIRDEAMRAPTGAAADSILRATAGHADLLAPCDRVQIATRIIWEDSGETSIHYSGETISDAELASLIASNGETLEPPAYRALAGLPSSIDVYWGRYYKGVYGSRQAWEGERTGGDRTVALHAYHGLTRAYSEAVEITPRCRVSSDAKGTITRTQEDGQTGETSTLGSYAIYYPADHGAMIERAFVGRPSGLTSNWIEDGEKIVARFGCDSDELRVLRENLRRYVEFADPLTGDEIEILLAKS